MEINPSHSSLQEASPQLATVADTMKNQASGKTELDPSPPLPVTPMTKAIWRRSPGKKDEFWEALQSHYNYLMDGELIETCKEANCELTCIDPESALTWTFTEFMDQYKQFLEWIGGMQKEITAAAENGHFDEDLQKTCLEELEKRVILRRLFNEQTQRLIKRYPDMEMEINCQSNHMNSQWERLEQIVSAPRNSKDISKEISANMQCLRKWLRDMECKLRPLTSYSGWVLKDLELKWAENQSLRKDIDSRGKDVNEILKFFNNVQSCRDATTADGDVQAIHRVALKLKRRWHTVLLRSLEWECMLDERIKKSKAGLLREDELDSSFSDEPLTKFPRLSGEWRDKTAPCLYNRVSDDDIHPQPCSFSDSDLDSKLEFDDMEIDSGRDLATVIPSDKMKTRDVGTDYETVGLPSTNEKGIMVGNTGIDQLKADCAGDYQNFEIIQDIGYSSESSTQLSNDERGGDISSSYSYGKKSPCNSENNINVENNSEFAKTVMQDNDSSNGLADSNCDATDDADENTVKRSGPNCATYYFRHVDTDSECKTDDLTSDVEKDLSNFYVCNPSMAESSYRKAAENVHSPSFMRRRQWSDTMLSTKPSSARMDVEFLTDVESPQSSLSEEETRPKLANYCMTDSQKLRQLASGSSKEQEEEMVIAEIGLNHPTNEMNDTNILRDCNNRESIQQLVEQAERLVQEESKKDVLEQLPQSLWLGEARAKKFLLKEWLNTHRSAACQRPAALPPETVIDSSCDASGEYTSNDSEDERSVSSEDQNNSVIMCYNMKSPDTIAEHKTPINESAKAMTSAAEKPKVILRSKKRNSRDRPWSVTELNQLTNSLGTTPFSASENALNKLAYAGQSTVDLKAGSFGSCQPGMLLCTDSSSRKSKSSKSRKRHTRRSDSGSEGVAKARNNFLPSGGSDGGSQKSPSHRKQSWHSKSHSSGSDSGRKHCSFSSSSKSAGHSSGTDQYSSEVILGSSLRQCNESDSDVEVVCNSEMIYKVHQSEELSSLSEQAEQAWDDYQDSPYLSEPYSEQLQDDEQVKNLMEFGDDYRKYIESHSDTASQSSYSGIYRFSNRQRQGMNCRSQMQYMDKMEPSEVDSDSDWEDLNHILQDSSNQLQYSTKLFRGKMNERTCQNSLPADHSELLATCNTNVKCLEDLGSNAVWASEIQNRDWSPKVKAAIKTLTSQWEMLKTTVQEQQKTSEKLKRVQKEMCELRESMTSIRTSLGNYNNQIDNKEMLDHMIKELQNYLASLQDKKTLLLTINLQVHSFLSSGESDVAALKAEVAALYYLWDQVFEKSNFQLNSYQDLMSDWTEFNSNLGNLQSTIQKVHSQANQQQQLNDGSSLKARKFEAFVESHKVPAVDSSAHTQDLTEEQMMTWHVQFATLQKQAKQLETMLADTYAWKNIAEQLKDVSSKLHHLKEDSIKPTGGVPCTKVRNVHFNVKDDVETSNKNHNVDTKSGDRKHSLLWRVMRAALPFQLAVVVLFCIACLMEPHCCDSINNFSLSFSPQLRYVRGPPPI